MYSKKEERLPSLIGVLLFCFFFILHLCLQNHVISINKIYKSILIFQYISRGYEEQQVICTRSLFIFTWHVAKKGPD
ncbi:hypothetical protein V7183_19530, partial [Bacillus sp. JJ1127]|uniref:hypothetical protein n=1 Tax=Bacillus sp. JJ1127 TaxID=3122952 RepID=UPI003000050F